MSFPRKIAHQVLREKLSNHRSHTLASVLLENSKTMRRKVTAELAAVTRSSFARIAALDNLTTTTQLLKDFAVLVAKDEEEKRATSNPKFHLSIAVMLATAANDPDMLKEVLDGSHEQLILIMSLLEGNIGVIDEAISAGRGVIFETLVSETPIFTTR